MTTEQKTVTLGGQQVPIVPLTLGLLKRIGVGNAKMQSGKGDVISEETAWYDGAREVLSAATGKKVEELDAMVGVTIQELTLAVREVFLLTGLVVEKEGGAKKPGEGNGTSTG